LPPPGLFRVNQVAPLAVPRCPHCRVTRGWVAQRVALMHAWVARMPKLLLHDRVVRHGRRRLRHQRTRRDTTPQGHWAAAPDPEPTSPTRSHSRLPVLVRGRARNPRRSCRPGRHHSPRSSTHAPTPALPHASRLVLAPPRTKASSTRFIYRRHCGGLAMALPHLTHPSRTACLGAAAPPPGSPRCPPHPHRTQPRHAWLASRPSFPPLARKHR